MVNHPPAQQVPITTHQCLFHEHFKAPIIHQLSTPCMGCLTNYSWMLGLVTLIFTATIAIASQQVPCLLSDSLINLSSSLTSVIIPNAGLVITFILKEKVFSLHHSIHSHGSQVSLTSPGPAHPSPSTCGSLSIMSHNLPNIPQAFLELWSHCLLTKTPSPTLSSRGKLTHFSSPGPCHLLSEVFSKAKSSMSPVVPERLSLSIISMSQSTLWLGLHSSICAGQGLQLNHHSVLSLSTWKTSSSGNLRVRQEVTCSGLIRI